MTYPASMLSPEIIDSIRKDSAYAEAQGMLSAEQLNIIYSRKWFRLFVPQEYGGLALSLPEAVRLEENLAYADGSLGWVVTLCAGAAMFIGYFNKELTDEIFTGPYTCLAGSGQSTGSAKKIETGFEINGSWPYASGAPHATHFTANCIIEGSREVQTFIFTKEEVTLHANWKYIGLNATAGYAYSVKNLCVPANRQFTIDAAHARLPGPIYRYPFLQLAETTIAVNTSGMCKYFLELATDILLKKHLANARSEAAKDKGLRLIARAQNKMELMRKDFYDALDSSWSSHIANSEMNASLQEVSRTSIELSQGSRNFVNGLYPYCGLDAARTGTPINQVWRNINTASQHTLLLDIN